MNQSMEDEYVWLVDRLWTESTLQAAIDRQNRLTHDPPAAHEDIEDGSTPRKVVECRICQDEGLDSNMEAPCSCAGSLRYAHRRCVQRWCDEKGDTTCEICGQQFKPGYIAPPPILRVGGLQMNVRGRWQVNGREVDDRRIITAVPSDRSSISSANYIDFDEELMAPTLRSIFWFRFVAMILMVVLLLRHTLPLLVTRGGNYSAPFVVMLVAESRRDRSPSLYHTPNDDFDIASKAGAGKWGDPFFVGRRKWFECCASTSSYYVSLEE